MNDKYEKPLPRIDETNRSYWEAAKQHELVLQRCQECGQGTVYTWTVFHQVYHPAFAKDVPYAVVAVELEEGPRLVTNLVDCKPEEIEVGMAVDISHCADTTTLDALEAARKPVLYTHAGCRALVPGHMRNKSDEMIRKMADTGGVMGIAMLRFLVRDQEPVALEHVLDHFDHVVHLVGAQHVGVGSDMDLIGNPNPVGGDSDPSQQPNFERYKVHSDEDGSITIRGLDHAKRVFDLTEGLIRRGYSDDDIKLMLGGNFERVLSEIWTL